ncbi:MAG: helix-turn-helix transcriptional regulator [Lachnospiraceae bacterium]|nr:helix-turn-helix transcriptional regulator [Lachnospiraceae bacterium]
MSHQLLDKLPKLLEDSEFASAWEDTRDEFALAREIICTRVAAGLSQKELADKIGTTQSVIARLESGTHTPSVSTLKRVAAATNAKLNISFAPIHPH